MCRFDDSWHAKKAVCAVGGPEQQGDGVGWPMLAVGIVATFSRSKKYAFSGLVYCTYSSVIRKCQAL